MNEKVEKISQNIYIALVKITFPGSVLPALFLSAINYIQSMRTDQDQIFILPYPAMYVHKSKYTFI